MKMLVLVLVLALAGAGVVQAEPAQSTVAVQAQDAYKLGLMYRNGGPGVAVDAGLAAHWIGVAAHGGLPEAMFTLANMLAAGEGVTADAGAARRWLEEAAALGYPAALQELAMREPDPRQAELLMRQAAHALQHP